jgi:hypothetical protein
MPAVKSNSELSRFPRFSARVPQHPGVIADRFPAPIKFIIRNVHTIVRYRRFCVTLGRRSAVRRGPESARTTRPDILSSRQFYRVVLSSLLPLHSRRTVSPEPVFVKPIARLRSGLISLRLLTAHDFAAVR